MFTKTVIQSLAAVFLLTCVARAVEMEYVLVGDPGNADDSVRDPYSGAEYYYGRVDYTYSIGKYEVTNAQYCEFLNAVAGSDPNGLYNTGMGSGWNDIGGIARSGSDGSYSYTVRPDRGDRPVNYVSWYDAARFANWLQNGQPTGAQGPDTTEDGAYDMSLGSSVVRKADARVVLPTEDEWYKAAYYKGGGTDAGYWLYPTQSNAAPEPESPPGSGSLGGSANYRDDYYIYHHGTGYIDETYYTMPVGAYTDTEGPYGTYDQAGNVWEWNETSTRSRRVMRGSSFNTWHSSFLRGLATSSLPPTDEVISVGFRVAYIPEPGGITFLACGLASALLWRRRR